jgi:hypothetical protein
LASVHKIVSCVSGQQGDLIVVPSGRDRAHSSISLVDEYHLIQDAYRITSWNGPDASPIEKAWLRMVERIKCFCYDPLVFASFAPVLAGTGAVGISDPVDGVQIRTLACYDPERLGMVVHFSALIGGIPCDRAKT